MRVTRLPYTYCAVGLVLQTDIAVVTFRVASLSLLSSSLVVCSEKPGYKLPAVPTVSCTYFLKVNNYWNIVPMLVRTTDRASSQ